MKKIRLIGLLFIIIQQAYSQQDTIFINKDTVPELPRIAFLEKEKNFGELKIGEKFTHTFTFRNLGKQPLYILGVQTGCDCTASEWERKAILSQQTGTITIVYEPKPNQLGNQRKNILVVSNATNKEELIYVKGTVKQ